MEVVKLWTAVYDKYAREDEESDESLEDDEDILSSDEEDATESDSESEID